MGGPRVAARGRRHAALPRQPGRAVRGGVGHAGRPGRSSRPGAHDPVHGGRLARVAEGWPGELGPAEDARDVLLGASDRPGRRLVRAGRRALGRPPGPAARGRRPRAARRRRRRAALPRAHAAASGASRGSRSTRARTGSGAVATRRCSSSAGASSSPDLPWSVDHAATIGSQLTARAASPLLLLCVAQFVLQLDFSIVNIALRTIASELGFSAAGAAVGRDGLRAVVRIAAAPGRAARGRARAPPAAAHGACGCSGRPSLCLRARDVAGDARRRALRAGHRRRAHGARRSSRCSRRSTPTGRRGPGRSGLWTAATAAGGVSGIVAGGVLTQYLGWRSIFLVNIPLDRGAAPGSARRRCPRSPGDRSRRLDMGGAITVTVAIGALIFGLSNGEQHGFGSTGSLAAFAACVLFGGGVHRRSSDGRGPDAPVLVPRRWRCGAVGRRDAGGRRRLRGVRVLRRPLSASASWATARSRPPSRSSRRRRR